MEIDLSLLSVLVTLLVGVCTIITFIRTNAKNEANRAADMAVIKNELEHQREDIKLLSTRVDKHNGFAERLPVMEEKQDVANHRISDLEDDVRKINDRMTRRNAI